MCISFSTVAQSLAARLPIKTKTALSYIDATVKKTSFVLFPTRHYDVRVIFMLNSGKGPAFGQIPNTILKKVGNIISVPLTHMIALSFAKGLLPI